MPKVAKDIVEMRPEEITAACRKLYLSRSFQEITIKDISDETSLSRPSIYNYFKTKEEIFLALLGDEYRLWNTDLERILASEPRSVKEFAHAVGKTLGKRETMLKIQCMNLYEIEENSSEEKLVQFKKEYSRSLDLMALCLEKFFPSLSGDEITMFVYEFFPFMYGLYPYAHPTEKQRAAMTKAGLKPPAFNVPDAVEKCIRDLLDKTEAK